MTTKRDINALIQMEKTNGAVGVAALIVIACVSLIILDRTMNGDFAINTFWGFFFPTIGFVIGLVGFITRDSKVGPALAMTVFGLIMMSVGVALA